MTVTTEEKSLFPAFPAGDGQAYRCIFDLHHPPLYQMVLGVVGDPEVAARIVQAAFDRLLLVRESIIDPSLLSHYSH